MQVSVRQTGCLSRCSIYLYLLGGVNFYILFVLQFRAHHEFGLLPGLETASNVIKKLWDKPAVRAARRHRLITNFKIISLLFTSSDGRIRNQLHRTFFATMFREKKSGDLSIIIIINNGALFRAKSSWHSESPVILFCLLQLRATAKSTVRPGINSAAKQIM